MYLNSALLQLLFVFLSCTSLVHGEEDAGPQAPRRGWRVPSPTLMFRPYRISPTMNCLRWFARFAARRNGVSEQTIQRWDRRAEWVYHGGLIATFLGGLALTQGGDTEVGSTFEGPPLEDDEIYLYYASPEPHVFVQIKDKVHSRGQGKIYQYDVKEYEKFSRLSHKYQNAVRIKLKLTKESVAELKEHYQNLTGKNYLFLPPLQHCANTTHDDLAKVGVCIPPGIGNSPSLTESYFRLRNLMGSETVQSVTFFARGYGSDRTNTLSRARTEDGQLNAYDMALHLYFLPDTFTLSGGRSVIRFFNP